MTQKQSPQLDYKGLRLVGGRESQNTETEIIPFNSKKVNKTHSNRDFSTDSKIRFQPQLDEILLPHMLKEIRAWLENQQVLFATEGRFVCI